MPRRVALLLTASVLASCGLPVTHGPSQPGTVCASNDQCASGFCVDGVCCGSACDGTCVSCAVPGSEGTCINVPDGDDPRHACGSGACAGVCDGEAACRFPGAEVSCGERVCAGDQIQQAACDGSGHCAIATTPCAPYACEDAACLEACADPFDCAVTGRCLPDGTCEAKLPPGAACAADSACASGYCADGVCCDKPCAGACEACNLPDSPGACTFIPAGMDPSNECPGGAPCGATCDGAGQCAYAPSGTACGAATCSAPDAPLTAQQCNGAGSCVKVQSACGTYACQGGGCRTSCGSSAECNSNAFCDNGACVLKRTLGEACGNGPECLSGICVEGVCCSSTCGDACDSCVAGTPGLCSPLGAGGEPQLSCGTGQACGQGAACPTQCSVTAPCAAGFFCDVAGTCQPKRSVGDACANDPQCGSGFCDDGVCCAEDCSNTPCRTCNAPGSLGQCLPLPWPTPATDCPGLYACQADGTCAVGTCSDDRDCKPNAFCDGTGACVAQQPAGATCSRARECGSGFCIDGVCCNTDCTGTCKACNLPGKTGTCSSIAAGQDPFLECPGGAACDGTAACVATCTSTAQCEQGYVCQGGACVGGTGLGLACTTSAECTSGHCVDGVCCATACTGACRACDLPNAAGTCTNVPANTDATGDCAGGLTCGPSGACRSTCTTNAQCEPGYGCKAGACVLLKANGATCTAGADCQSGACTDGVCCSGACSGTCEACNVPGLLGACVPFAAGTDPQSECAATNQTCNGQSACGTTCMIDQDCAVGAYCNAGACAQKAPQGAACTANNQCTSSSCVDGVCCDTACQGDCRACNVPGNVGTCTIAVAGTDPDQDCAGGLACNNAGACNVSCSAPLHCEQPYWCNGGACQPDLPQGGACTDPSQCGNGLCVDGVCCQSACGGTCEACNLTGTVGTCSPYTARTDPQNECGTAWCSGSASCLQPCGTDPDCKPGHYCRTDAAPATCSPQQPNGVACTANNECLSGSCVDGVCCDTACVGACSACNNPGSAGTCSPVPNRQDPANDCGAYLCNGAGACTNPCTNDLDCDAGSYCSSAGTCLPKEAAGTACTADTECASNACVDGVCCNTACDGVCQACNLPGNVGTCSPIAAQTDPANECGTTYCDGANACATSCPNDTGCKAIAYCTGPGGTCQPDHPNGAACANANECTSGFCIDGACCNAACGGVCQSCNLPGSVGTCTDHPLGTDPANECLDYTCSGAGACTTLCTDDTQCDPLTAGCVGGSCQKRPNANACTASTQCQSGACIDGLCCDTACTGACEACNLPGKEGACTPRTEGTDPENGCGLYLCDGTGQCHTDCTQGTRNQTCKSGSCNTSGTPAVCNP